MSDGPDIQSSDTGNVDRQIAQRRSLASALAEVKNRLASRDDVVVDMKAAEQARLELLADEVRPLFEDLPEDNDQFEFSMSYGKPPRLWVDMTAHVSMGRDRRQYRFLKDTRAGRIVLAESSSMSNIADAIGYYVAERVLLRERILEGEWTSLYLEEQTVVSAKQARKRGVWTSAIWFVSGFVASVGGLYLLQENGLSLQQLYQMLVNR